jgi:signal transduction histidine kinase/ABC-type uncharacterized transport system substrate-binding protein
MLRATFLLACCFLAHPAPSAGQGADVLVVYSNNRLLPANIEVERGLREVLETATGGKLDLFAEFLDRPAFLGEAHEARMAAYLVQKYATRPPRVIVAAGEAALWFVLSYRTGLFSAVPVVHAALSRTTLESGPPLPADVIGIPVDDDLPGNVALAMRWHPGARRVVVVTGTSPWDRAREAEIRAGVAQLEPKPSIEYVAGLPTADVVARLAALGRDDVVFTPGYFRDGAGREFSPRESVVAMADASGAPVYGPYGTFIGTGVVGGRMVDFEAVGRATGNIVARLLDGVPVSSVSMPARIAAPVQVDWRQVGKWGIREDVIPPDAIVHHRTPTFWESYRTQALVVALVVLLQAILIGALLVERRRRRNTATALAESEQRISLAAYAGRLSMWMWDLAHDQVWTTARLRDRAGLPGEVPVSFDQVLQTVHPADRERFNHVVRSAAASGQELDVEYRVIQPDGEVRWFVARGHAAAGTEHCLTGVKMDITPRKAAELQAAGDRAALTHLSRVSTMGQLSAAIAHQLNQPLAAILGNAETGRKLLGRDPVDHQELREILDDIVGEDNRAAEIIRRLGALYKRGEMELARLDLNELARETLDLVRAELMTRNVSAETEFDPALPPIRGGRIQLQQVLLNLILNAADAMSGVDVDRRVVVVRTSFDGDQVRLCVTDRGTGIAADALPHVFDAFWSTKATGAGVGLAICHSIITAHQGTLEAYNNAGGGATFCFALPSEPRTDRDNAP